MPQSTYIMIAQLICISSEMSSVGFYSGKEHIILSLAPLAGYIENYFVWSRGNMYGLRCASFAPRSP